MNLESFIEQSKPFMDYMLKWEESLTPISLERVTNGKPDRVVVISVDVINGFCYEGPLASPRVANIVQPITDLFLNSYKAGIRQFIVTQDAHTSNSVEFESYPPHCVRGTSESESVDSFKRLPFWDIFQVMQKESINSALGTDLDGWIHGHPYVDTFIAVGDCTDLCTYQLAMHLKLKGNAANKKVRVLVPVNCVETYDLPVSVAQDIDAIPHDGDFLNIVFLYSMMLNGVEVVAKIV